MTYNILHRCGCCLVALLAALTLALPCLADTASDVKAAEELMASGKYADAIVVLNQTLSSNSSPEINRSARIRLSECYDSLGDWQRSRPIHRDLAREFKDIEAEQLYYLARCFTHQGVPGSAAKVLEIAAKHPQQPKDPAVRKPMLVGYAEAVASQQRIDDAKTTYKTLLRDYPDNKTEVADWTGRVGTLCRLSGDLPGAIAAYKELVAKYPDSGKDSRNWLAWCCLANGEYDKSLALYQAYLKDYPDSVLECNYSIGCCYHGKGDFDKAVAIFQELVSKHYDWLRDRIARGPNTDIDGTKVLLVIVSKDADWALESLRMVAQCNERKKKYGLAASAYEKLVANYPSAPSDVIKDAKLRIAECHHRCQQWDKAIEEHENLAKVYPDEAAQQLSFVAYCYKSQEKYSEQIAAITRALAVATDPKHKVLAKDLKLEMAEAYKCSDGPEKAAALYREMIAAYPESANNLNYKLAKCYYEAGMYSDAVISYEALIKQAPEYGPKCIFEMGRSYQAMGDCGHAEPLLREAIKQFALPDYRGSYGRLHLAMCLAGQKRVEEVMAVLDKYAEDYPTHRARALLWKGEILVMQAKEYEMGAAFLRQWFTEFSSQEGDAGRLEPFAKGFLIVALEKIGRVDEAVQVVKKGLSSNATLGSRAECALRVGELYCRSGRYADAATSYSEALGVKSISAEVNAEATYRLALCFSKMGRSKAAQDYLRSVVKQYPHSSQAKQARGQLYLMGVPVSSVDRAN